MGGQTSSWWYCSRVSSGWQLETIGDVCLVLWLLRELRPQAAWIRKSALGSCKTSGDAWVDSELWKTVEKDVAEGWASDPLYFENEVTRLLGGESCWIASKRVPVVQDAGNEARGVDDLSASLVNSTVTTCEKIAPGSSDRVAALIAFVSWAASDPAISIPLLSGEVLEGVRRKDFEASASRAVLGTTIDCVQITCLWSLSSMGVSIGCFVEACAGGVTCVAIWSECGSWGVSED